MRESEHFNLNLVEGSDIVNPLVTDVPNYESIDEQMFKNQIAGVQNATELKTGTIHAITRLVPDAQMITFTATSNFVAGDTFTVDGIQVSALTVGGEQLPTGAYVINSQVLAILKGTLLTVYGVGSAVADNALALNGHPDTYFGTKEGVDNAINTANAANTLAESTSTNLENNYTENVTISSCTVFGRIVWASATSYALICEIPYWLYAQGYRCNSVRYDVAYAGAETVPVSSTSNRISVTGTHITSNNSNRLVTCTLNLYK